MKKLLLAILFLPILAFAATPPQLVYQGGTGWGNFTAGSLLYGNGSLRLATTTAATQGYQLVYLNSAPTWVATTTYSSPLSWSNGAVSLSTSGTWSGNAGTATALAANGTNCTAGNYPLGVDVSGNSEGCTVANTGTLTAVTATWPILSSGGTTPVVSWAGLATSSALTAGRVHYSTGVNTFADIATSSETCSAPLLCAAHTVLTGGGAISWLGLATTSQPSSSNVLVSNGTSGVYGVATSSLGVTSPITFSGTLGAQLGGANGSFACATCNTTNATVSSVGLSDANSTLTIGGTPVTTSGTLTATLNLAHANTWTGQQTFNTSAPIFGTLSGLLQGNGASAATAVTGTAGQFPYYNGSNTLLATSTLFLATSGNVGIGSTTPDSPFVVSGAIGAISSTPLTRIITTGINNGFGLALDASGSGNNNFAFMKNGATKAGMTYDGRGFYGFVNFAYSGNDFSLRINDNGSLEYLDPSTVGTFGFANLLFHVSATGQVGIGTSTPLANFQVASTTSNATTSVQFGKAGQNKGTCMTYYDTAGTPVYGFIAAGATAFTYTATKPSGCQN
jgi:hypothetical protein